MVAGMLEELEVVSVTTIYILNYSVCRPGAIITELEKWYRSEARLETHYLRNASHYPKTLFWITKVFQLLQNISELPKSGWNTLHLFLIIFWKWKSLSRVLFFATPMDYTVHGILQARILELGIAQLLQGIVPAQGSNPGLPTLQADSLPAEPQEKPKNTGVGSLSLPQWIFLIQESNWGLLHCRWILYQLSFQGSPLLPSKYIQSLSASLEVWGRYCIFCPVYTRVATREESGGLGVPSRRGLTPRGSLECNPEIPAFPGEEN